MLKMQHKIVLYKIRKEGVFMFKDRKVYILYGVSSTVVILISGQCGTGMLEHGARVRLKSWMALLGSVRLGLSLFELNLVLC